MTVYIISNADTSSDQSKALRKNFAGIGFVYDSVRDEHAVPATRLMDHPERKPLVAWRRLLGSSTDNQSMNGTKKQRRGM